MMYLKAIQLLYEPLITNELKSLTEKKVDGSSSASESVTESACLKSKKANLYQCQYHLKFERKAGASS